MRIENSDYQRFVACCLLNLLAVLPIILANRLYIDDLGRSIDGYFGWGRDGRVLAEGLFDLANLGAPAVNVFPLYQLAAVAIMALAALILSEMFDVRRPVALALGCLPLIAQPYYLQNVSYAFDALMMSAAILVAVAAAWSATRARAVWHYAVAAMLLVASLMTYQAATSCFLIFYVGALCRETARNGWRGNVGRLVAGVVVFAIATVLYVAYLSAFVSLGGYAGRLSSTVPPDQLISGLSANLSRFWGTLDVHWVSGASTLAPALIVGALTVTALGTLALGRTSGPVSITSRVVAVIGLSLVILTAFGPMLLMQSAPLLPRLFIGVGAVLCLMSLLVLGAVSNEGTLQPARIGGYALVASLAYAMIVVSFAYGRASTAQKEFEAGLLAPLAGIVAPLVDDGRAEQLVVRGTVQRSPLLAHTARKFPVIDRLVPRHLSENWWWAHVQLRHHGVSLEYVRASDEWWAEARGQAELVREAAMFDLYLVGKTLVIRFPDAADDIPPN